MAWSTLRTKIITYVSFNLFVDIVICFLFFSKTVTLGFLLIHFFQVPQQKNDYDCGLFVLFFMERFIEEAPERLKKKDLAMVPVVFLCDL